MNDLIDDAALKALKRRRARLIFAGIFYLIGFGMLFYENIGIGLGAFAIAWAKNLEDNAA